MINVILLLIILLVMLLIILIILILHAFDLDNRLHAKNEELRRLKASKE